jgi:hypothetical protein
MLERLRRRLTYANVMATLAVFLALGGGAYALTKLDRNSVRSRHIVNGQVKARDLVNPAAVKSAGLVDNTKGCFGITDQWASSNNGFNGRVGYYRDVDGIVHLTGEALRCGTPPSPDTIFTLPAGYRPSVNEDIPAVKYTGDGVAAMVILRDGSVGLITTGSAAGTPYSLDGISFRCGPSGKNGCP